MKFQILFQETEHSWVNLEVIEAESEEKAIEKARGQFGDKLKYIARLESVDVRV